jgi:hypothetical protein
MSFISNFTVSKTWHILDVGSIVLHEAMSSKASYGEQLYVAVFIILWLFLGKVIFFDLIVAVLVEKFEVRETIRLLKKPGKISGFRALLKASYRSLSDLLHVGHFEGRKQNPKIFSDFPCDERPKSSAKVVNAADADDTCPAGTHYQLLVHAMTKTKNTSDAIVIPDEPTVVIHAEETSLYIFRPTNRFRSMCRAIKDNQIFKITIYLSIFVSCILVLATPPAEDVPGLSSPIPLRIRLILDDLLTAIFAIECFVTVVAQVRCA